MIRSDHVYTKILNETMEDAQRKDNPHYVLEFARCNTWFLVQETINLREVQPVGNFTVRLYQRWWDCDKLQKAYLPCMHVVSVCKQAYHEYKAYIDPMYTLKSVSNVYIGLLDELCNEEFWLSCHEPPICLNQKMLRNSKGHLISSCIHQNGCEIIKSAKKLLHVS